MTDHMSEIYEIIKAYIEESQEEFLKYAAMENKSPIYNKNWETDGELLSCINQIKTYLESLNITGIDIKIFEEKGITPALYFSVPSTDTEKPYNVLFLSGIDKIPFGDNWVRVDPYHPKVIDSYLYGRGSASTLYSIFSIIGIIKALDELSIKRPKISVLLESSFESNSCHLETHLTNLKKLEPTVNQIICMNTWSTSNAHFHLMKSCRGLISFDVKITTGQKQVHSGLFGGLIPDPVMIFHNLLSDKIEVIEKSEETGAVNIKIPELEIDVTDEQKAECEAVGTELKSNIINVLPYRGYSNLIGGIGDKVKDQITAYMNGVLRPSMTILGIEGIPSMENMNGSLSPDMRARLCFRTPPSLDVNKGFEDLKKKITENPLFNAKIEILNEELIPGIDLETNKSFLTNEQFELLKTLSKAKIKKEIQPLRLARELPSMKYLADCYNNVPIFVTGAGDTFSGNIRNPDECIRLLRLADFSTIIACYISQYNSF